MFPEALQQRKGSVFFTANSFFYSSASSIILSVRANSSPWRYTSVVDTNFKAYKENVNSQCNAPAYWIRSADSIPEPNIVM